MKPQQSELAIAIDALKRYIKLDAPDAAGQGGYEIGWLTSRGVAVFITEGGIDWIAENGEAVMILRLDALNVGSDLRGTNRAYIALERDGYELVRTMSHIHRPPEYR